MGNIKKYKWKDINQKLYQKGWSTKHLGDLLIALPRKQKSFSWNELNSALMKMGKSTRNILDTLLYLNKNIK